ncbi:MAG TPA: hypothetical protein VGK94_14440 [Candidatus Polarisedimenticolia bacterium]|jgi:hypothetical protein
MKRILVFCLAAMSIASGITTALALDHLMVIQEVFPGTPADPNAQYVMLRMTSSGQTLLNGDFVELQDSAGNVLGRFGTFAANVANGGAACAYPNCPAAIIGTSAAQTLLGFAFDTVVDSQPGRVALPLAGGRVCFRNSAVATDIPDCVAYAGFTGSNTIATPTTNGCDANFGTPAPALSPGFALTRKLFNCTAKENSNDFENRFPHPVANSGANANADADADGLINVLDCGVNDATSLYSVEGVTSLAATGGATVSLSWSAEPAPAGTSLRYDVSRFVLADLTSQPSCDEAAGVGFFVGSGLTTLSLDDADLPGPNQIFYYAVRSRNGCGGAKFC